MSQTTDMTGGLYRRIYAGFLTSRRINSVGWAEEAWFWRLHAIADDFGNLNGDPIIIRSFAAPLRSMTVEDVQRMTADLINAGLIGTYEFNGEPYLHIDGFEDRQPAGRNGKRIQKHPMHDNVKMGNSGGILGNPDSSGSSKHTIPIPIPIPIPKTKEPPLPPKGGKTAFHATYALAKQFMPDATLDTAEFRAAWEAWAETRRGAHRLTEIAVRKAIEKCHGWGHDAAIAALDTSTIGGYRGLFAPKDVPITPAKVRPRCLTSEELKHWRPQATE